mgnify:CR=1 FL=1
MNNTNRHLYIVGDCNNGLSELTIDDTLLAAAGIDYASDDLTVYQDGSTTFSFEKVIVPPHTM